MAMLILVFVRNAEEYPSFLMVKGPTTAASVMTLLASCLDTFVPKSQSAKKIVSVETFAMLLETETIAISP